MNFNNEIEELLEQIDIILEYVSDEDMQEIQERIK